MLTFREISNIVKLEKEVNERSKTIKILHGLSHELKTPLNHIINQQLELLNPSYDLSETAKHKLTKSVNISQFLLSLLRDMIDYSYIKYNNFAMTCNWFSIVEVIEESISIVKNSKENSIILLNKQNYDQISVYSDMNKIRQVLLSLITISLGYCLFRISKAPSSTITINYKNNKAKIVILFNTFTNFSLSIKSTLDYLAQSVQLKISKKIIEKTCQKPLKSKFDNNNNNIMFTIYFESKSLYSDNEEILEIPSEGSPIWPYRILNNIPNKTTLIDILIVDDIEFNIDILKRLISNLKSSCKCGKNHKDLSIHTASSGKQAINSIIYQNSQLSGYKIVLMDCMMPELDGWEACKQINELFTDKKIKILPFIIAYSAFDSKDDLNKCKDAGMVSHISKPSYQEEICNEIHRWITVHPLNSFNQ